MWLFKITALISGLLFGAGMVISGMTQPEKVIAFLDITGDWEPNLALVMGGALVVFMPSYFGVIKPKLKSLTGQKMCFSNKKKLDASLFLGAVIFGLGWGIAGICPGPAVSSLAMGNQDIILFLFCVMIGSLVGKKILEFKQKA